MYNLNTTFLIVHGINHTCFKIDTHLFPKPKTHPKLDAFLISITLDIYRKLASNCFSKEF